MPTKLEIACPRCGRPVRLTTEIAPLGSKPGHRIYHCLDCGRLTILDVVRPLDADTTG
jgi:DNA-directed RNA polymerase subunit RPC12/RpoP